MNRSHIPARAAKWCAAAILLAAAVSGAARDAYTESPYINESPAAHDARMKWWREARFGMFIHWGLYSQLAGQWRGANTSGAGEWIMNDLRIPDSQYAETVKDFNPVKFDARRWVAIAKDAGMKYIVITSKHHEGFGMYDSALTDWCIKSTPFGRDPLKELSVACREAGIKLCFYHSIMDWHHPDYLPKKPWNDLANPNPDFDNYVNYMKAQLKELLTGYGPIGILWFDGEWENTWTYDRGVDLYNYIRSLQPNIIVNNRVGREVPPGKPKIGDYGTPEQYIPANGYGPGVDWETCMTMNDTWGYKKLDTDWKSTETLVRNLIDIASKGGNYLLNVGPTGEGLIPEASVDRLQEIGLWMRFNGESIYDTTASPFKRQLPWGRCTTKAQGRRTTLYFHVFDWPADGRLLVPGLKTKPRRAFLLASDTHNHLPIETTDDGVVISVPPDLPHAISTTVVAEFNRPIEIAQTYLLPEADGSVVLRAVDASLHGSNIQYEQGDSRNNIGFWTNPEDYADWQFKLTKPGKFAVSAVVAAPSASSFEVSLGGTVLRASAPQTSSYTDFKDVDLGSADLSPGVVTVSIHAVKDGWNPINIRALNLKPLPGQ